MGGKKNIWIFCHYAQQPPFNTMLRYHNWGKFIQRKGYKVTIVAASTVHNTSTDVIKENGGKKEQRVDGVRYLYVQAPQYSGNGIQRIRNMLSYCLGIRQFKKYPEQPDYILVCEAYLLPFVKHMYRKKPVICDIVDLWPLSITEYTAVSDKNLFIRLLYGVEKYAYVHCDALVFSMEGGIDYVKEQKYASKVDLKKIFHINMGCDLAKFDENLKNQINVVTAQKPFTVTYCGSIRQANHVMQVCEAAKILKSNGYGNIRIRFFGNGPGEDEAKEYCVQNKLDNVEFHGRFKKDSIPEILFESDANIMTYMQTKVMKYGGSQSKLFDYLASGKPVINCGDWGYNLISRYECGVVVCEQTGHNIADAICVLYELPVNELSTMGKNARMVAEKYDQPQLVEKLDEVIKFVSEDSKVKKKGKI